MPNVSVQVEKKFTFHIDGQDHTYMPGHHSVPEEYVSHWFFKHHIVGAVTEKKPPMMGTPEYAKMKQDEAADQKLIDEANAARAAAEAQAAADDARDREVKESNKRIKVNAKKALQQAEKDADK